MKNKEKENKIADALKKCFGDCIEIGFINIYPGGLDTEFKYPKKFNFSSLKELSETLGTEEIVFDKHHYSGGCPTCDYGGYDEIELSITNINWKKFIAV